MSRARAAHLEHLVKRRLIIQTGNWRRTLIEIRDKRRHALLPPSHNEVGFKMHLHCLDFGLIIIQSPQYLVCFAKEHLGWTRQIIVATMIAPFHVVRDSTHTKKMAIASTYHF